MKSVFQAFVAIFVGIVSLLNSCSYVRNASQPKLITTETEFLQALAEIGAAIQRDKENGELVSVRSQTGITPECFRYLGDSQHLKEIQLAPVYLHDNDLHVLADLCTLESLDIDGCRLSDVTLCKLAKLPALIYLRICSDQISGDDVVGFHALRTLRIDSASITDIGVKSLLKNSKVELLAINSGRDKNCLSDNWMLQLHGNIHINNLQLYNVPLKNSKVDNFPSLPQLRFLHLHSPTNVKQLSLDYVSKMAPNLESLSLSSVSLDEKGLISIRALQHLKRLELICTTLNEEDHRHIPNELETLEIYPVTTSLDSFSHLKRLKDLRLCSYDFNTQRSEIGLNAFPELLKLDLTHSNVSVKLFDEIATHNRCIQTLTLNFCAIDDECITAIASLPNLEVLEIRNATISGAALSTLAKCQKLRRLDISGVRLNCDNYLPLLNLSELTELILENTNVDDSFVGELSKSTRLTKLNLSGSLITERSFMYLNNVATLDVLLLSSCNFKGPDLMKLTLTNPKEIHVYSDSISKADIVKLRRRHPGCLINPY